MSTRLSTPDILGNALTGKAQAEKIPLASIKTDGGTQMRAAVNWETVKEYADAMREGDTFPPIVTYYDGETYWLADGFHRLAAWKQAFTVPGAPGVHDPAEIPAEVKAGGRRDAILHAINANANHGLRRTNADKRRAVEVLLRDLEWSQWSNGAIAKACGVSDMFVGALRKELTPNGLESAIRIGADGRTINTANIGANRPAPSTQPAPAPDSDYAPVWQLEVGVRKAVATKWAAATDERIRLLVLAEMNQARLTKAGALWVDVKNAMPDTVKAYRHQDLQQAIANVADQLRQAMQREAQPEPAKPTTQKRESAVHPFAVKLHVWQWLNDQTGGDPRKIVELAERIHAMDMRHPQWWQMYPAGADAQDVIDALEDCIDEAAARVAEFAGGPKPLEEDVKPAPAGYSHPSMAGLPVLSLPTEYYDEPDPEPEHPLDTYDNEKATPDARRMERLWDTKQELKRIIEEILPRWDNLTGRATESLAAYRELRKLIDILEDEMDALDPNVTKKEVTLA